MARLPTVVDFARQIPESRRRVVADRSGEIIGESLSAAGANLASIAERRSQREDKFAYAQAKSSFLRSDIESRKTLQDDDDWQGWEQRYRESMSKGLEESLKVLTPGDRALFEVDAKLDIERGAEKIRELARGREVDQASADLMSVLDDNRAAALEADEETQRAIIDNTIDVIGAAQESGYLDAAQAESIRRKWTTDFAEGAVSMLSAAERVEMLSSPDGTVAEYIQPDRRLVLLNAAKSENREIVVRWESQRRADSLLGKHDSETAALVEARQISDPEVRDATVTRVKARFTERAQAEDDMNRQAFQQASTSVEESWSIDGIEPNVWRNVLNTSQRQALETRSRQLRQGEDPKTDAALWRDIRNQITSDPQEFAERDLMADRHMLSLNDFQWFVEAQNTIKAGGDEAGKLFSGVRTHTQIVDDTLREIGIDPTPNQGSTAAKQVAEFSRQVDERVQALQLTTGKPATTQDVQQIVDDLAVKGATRGGVFGFFTRERHQFELETGETFTVSDVGEVPPAERQKIESALKRANRPISDDVVLSLYNQKLGVP